MHSYESLKGNWNYPTLIRFGVGRITELADACQELGIARPLLVTDPGLADLPMVREALRICEAAGLDCGLFSEVQSNPVAANVEAGIRAYRVGGHDGVIAFGGGSVLDVAKAVALMVGQQRPLWDFEDRGDWYKRINVDNMSPVVAIPTTSGTGSEVGRASVITDQHDRTKKIVFHPNMLPALVIADPTLTIGLPPDITAAVGMDALSRNLEAYCSPLYHPMAHGIALEGIRLIKTWLPEAYQDGNNIEARAHMMAASMLGATASQKGLGAMHSLSHACSAMLNTHHGLTNAVVMPYVLLFNRPAITDKLTALAHYLDFPNPSFQAILDWVLTLRSSIGIPHTLAELGVKEEHAGPFAKMAEVDPASGTNPVSLTAENLERLLFSAIRGML